MRKNLMLLFILSYGMIRAQESPRLLERFSDPTQYVNSGGIQGSILYSDPSRAYFEPEAWDSRFDVNLAKGPLRLNMSMGISNLVYAYPFAHSFSDFRLNLAYAFNLKTNYLDRISAEIQYQIPLNQGALYGNGNGWQLNIKGRSKLSERLHYYPGLILHYGRNPYLYQEPFTYLDPLSGDSITFWSESRSQTTALGLGISNRLTYRFTKPFYLQGDFDYLWTEIQDWGEAYPDQARFSYSELRTSLSLHYVYRNFDFSIATNWRFLFPEESLGWRTNAIEPSWGLGLRYAFE